MCTQGTWADARIISAVADALKVTVQIVEWFPKGRRSSNLTTILIKKTRLLNLKKDMFRQLLCHRQFTDRITILNNIYQKIRITMV